MGVDKASLVFGGRTLLQRTVDALAEVVDEIVVVRSPGQELPELLSPLPVRVVQDAVEGEGPLVGIAAGLRGATAPVSLVVACDMPFLQPVLLRLLAERAAAGRRFVVPVDAEGPQPLCSAFRREALKVVQEHIDAGDRKIMSVAGDLDVDRVSPHEWAAADPGGRSFENVNTLEEFEAAVKRERERARLRARTE
ncbi:MAG: molybdenum cofactor guanylyltransferase [Planctomycetes bacterium]|nr:molybdenum cofactor guanylyltransferase [Planctomycetota bacterium]